ncbi:MAG TPA: hypothetical protein PKA53_05815 [Sphingobacterium sp.]|nr:hypothetical protein [Sphingobacterium sp.]
MKIIKAAFLLGIGSLIVWSCNSSTREGGNADDLSLEKLTNYPEADKQHLFFRLTGEEVTDSSVIYTARSVFEEDTVGVKLEVLKGIQPGVTAEGHVAADIGFTEGTLKLSTVGEESDNFVKALGTMFGLETAGEMTSEVLLPTVFSSNKGEVDLSKNATYSFKLFFENAQGEPAEVFAILDTYRRAFEITEKDAEYRGQLLSAFEGK